MAVVAATTPLVRPSSGPSVPTRWRHSRRWATLRTSAPTSRRPTAASRRRGRTVLVAQHWCRRWLARAAGRPAGGEPGRPDIGATRADETMSRAVAVFVGRAVCGATPVTTRRVRRGTSHSRRGGPGEHAACGSDPWRRPIRLRLPQPAAGTRYVRLGLCGMLSGQPLSRTGRRLTRTSRRRTT